MAPRSKVIVAPGWCLRDAGKTFLLSEWPALRANKWAWRTGLAIKGTTGYIPEEIVRFGIVGVWRAGLTALLASDIDPAKLEPLLVEMLECAKIIRDPKAPEVATPIQWELRDVEEQTTIEWLRKEILELHAGFPVVESFFNWLSTIYHQEQSNTPTSPPTSASPSLAEKPASLN